MNPYKLSAYFCSAVMGILIGAYTRPISAAIIIVALNLVIACLCVKAEEELFNTPSTTGAGEQNKQ